MRLSNCVLVVGPRKCGKSLFVEKVLSSRGSCLYLGTLWPSEAFTGMIENHKARRHSGWILVESEGRLPEDLINVGTALDSMKDPRICMIDGLTNWAMNCARHHGDLPRAAREVVEAMMNMICTFREVEWGLVDVRPEDFEIEDRPLEAMASRIIHSSLGETIKLVDYTNLYSEYL